MNLGDLNPFGAILDIGSKVLDRVIPDPAQRDTAKLELMKAAQAGDLAQIQVNVEEAKSTNWFVAGWRPAVGWVGAAGLAYVALVEPLGRFVAEVGFHYTGTFPAIDTTITMQVLLGMLGLGAMRSVEKVKGAEGNR